MEFKNWESEKGSAVEFLRTFNEKADRAYDRYVDEDQAAIRGSMRRLNLFHSTVTTMRCMIYGNKPRVDASRSFADPDDDVARVASNLATRLLNLDIMDDSDTFCAVMKNVLEDFLVTDLGEARIKYDVDKEEMEVPGSSEDDSDDGDGPDTESAAEDAPETMTVIKDQWVDTIYVHRKDVLWPPCRTYAEMRWKAYRSFMEKPEFTARFGRKKADETDFNKMGPEIGTQRRSEPSQERATMAEIWEVWDKETKRVYWACDSYRGRDWLDEKEDPWKLDGFYPSPSPLSVNTSSRAFVPKPDYAFWQDLYTECDGLYERISMLTDALRVAGVYDQKFEELQNLLSPRSENVMIPVDNYAAFAEKGGVKGSIDWYPVEVVAEVVVALGGELEKRLALLYQVSGLNELMRGGGAQPYASSAEVKLQGQFGSARQQFLMDEFSRYAADIQRLKFQVVARHYLPETIIKYSNALYINKADQPYIPEALKLIKSEDSRWRIDIRSESMSISNYSELKQDRVAFMEAVSLFVQSMGRFVQEAPIAMPAMLEMLKWGVSGFRGSKEIEGVLDRAISQFDRQQQQNQGQEKPDPAIQKLQLQMQAQDQKHQQKLQEIQAQMAAKMQEIQAKMQADWNKERAQYEFDAKGATHEAELDMVAAAESARRDHERLAHERVAERERAANRPPSGGRSS